MTGPWRATGLAASVSRGERSAVSLAEAALAAIGEGDGAVAAFRTVTAEAALHQAEAVDAAVAAGEAVGPLAGVPIAVKDNICTRGIETSAGSRILEGWIPPYDATVIDRLRSAGAVIVGKTNLDEFAMGSSTENSAYGPTRNPVDHSRVPGGSSGGSAAAVAAGFVPLALGSDTGGSIRQPASFCGVVGVKPTYGRVSRWGLIAFASSLDQIGPLAADVADAALCLDAIWGHDPSDSTSIPLPTSPVSDHLDDGVDGLRVGVVSELMGEGMDTEVVARVRSAAEALSAAGAVVSDVSVPAVHYGISAYYIIAPGEASSNLARYDGVRFGHRVDATTTPEMYEETRTAGFGDEVKRRIMLGTYALSAGYFDAYYGTAQKVRTLLVQDFAAAYASVDVLLSPVAPTTAFELGSRTDDPLQMYLGDICTIPTNLAGHAAMSVPFGTDTSDLPIGVQIMSPALGEADMFRAAAVIEAASKEVR